MSKKIISLNGRSYSSEPVAFKMRCSSGRYVIDDSVSSCLSLSSEDYFLGDLIVFGGASFKLHSERGEDFSDGLIVDTLDVSVPSSLYDDGLVQPPPGWSPPVPVDNSKPVTVLPNVFFAEILSFGVSDYEDFNLYFSGLKLVLLDSD
ncbi:hypothetical protein LNI89_09235 [Tenacibaculum dicentrarchi]|nr:hypothetical protein [Tenacibaculum dicentrarchi]MCD8420662.1 hypothetical protein [Tenacibaculum dicentrarchi]